MRLLFGSGPFIFLSLFILLYGVITTRGELELVLSVIK